MSQQQMPQQLNLPQPLVTGEAVTLEISPASFATRMLGATLDLVVQAVVLWALLLLAAGVMRPLEEAAQAAVATLVLVLVLVAAPAGIEHLSRGRSLGKLAAGLRVVQDDGSPVRLRQSIVRALLAVLENFATAGTIAMFTSLANPRGKRMGDLLAGTYVIRDRIEAHLPPLPPVPTELRTWAAGSDLARLPDRLAMAARQLLGRLYSLHPEARRQLAVQLAEQVSGYVAPAPPAGTSPEAFLAAVLVERRRRELERLQRQAQTRRAREAVRAAAPVHTPESTRLVGDPAPAE